MVQPESGAPKERLWYVNCSFYRENIMLTRQTTRVLLVVVLAVGAGTHCSTSPDQKAARFLITGKRFLERKDYPRAILQFRNAAQVTPKDAEPHYQLGLAFLAQGAIREAFASFHMAVERNPKHAEAQLKLAQLLGASGKKELVEQAETRLRELTTAYPANADFLDALAGVQIRLGKADEAERHLQEALKRAPAHLKSSSDLAALKLLQNNPAGAEEVLKNAIQQAPRSVEAALALGHLYMLTGRTAHAQSEMRRALSIDPQSTLALAMLGTSQMAAGRKQEAEQTYRQLSMLPDARYRPVLGRFLFQQGRHDEAIEEFKRLAQQDPSDRAARSRLVMAYIGVNRVAEAEKLLAAALKRNAKDTAALLERGGLYLQSGKEIEAEKDFQQVLHYESNSARARYGLARAYRLRGRELLYRGELEQALRLAPDLLAARVELAVALVGSNNAKAALQVLDEAPAAQRQALPLVIARNAALLAAGDEAGARESIARGLAVARLPDLLLQDAYLKLQKKDLKGALAAVEEALKRSPGDVRGWQFLGSIYATQKQFPQAVERLRQAAAQQPRSAALQYLLGTWMVHVQDRAAARTAFAAAKAADPAFVAADLSVAQLDLADGQIDSARRTLIGITSRREKYVPGRLLLGMLEERAQQPEAAISHYRVVVEADASNLVALNNLAYLLILTNPAEALKYAQQAAALDGSASSIQDTLGWAYYHNGMYDAAIRHLENAVAKESTGLRKYHLGMAYLKQGDRERARRHLKAAVEMDPKLVF
jgi:tetratricopeptide (TPR) repeat protein